MSKLSKPTEQSLEIQTIDMPSDIRQAAITSPATIFLCRLEGGDLMEEVTAKLREVAAASYNTSKKGKLTLELEFSPSGARKMDIKASVKTKIPQEDRAPSTQFVTGDGQLHAYDPEQQRMDLRVVKVHDTEARVIDIEEPEARKIA